MKTKIAVAKGDGIGPEIMDAVLKVFEAYQLPLSYEWVEMGETYFNAGYSAGMTPKAREHIENLGVLFKGPMETPKGAGMKSVNVTVRKIWNAYANKRDFRTLHGVDTVFSKAGIPINLTVVRENIEDTYGGIEYLLTYDVALARRIITRPGSEQVIRYAFELASATGVKKIVCGHKANIMKLTDGLFLEAFYHIAESYPHIQASDLIVDDLCMKLVMHPDWFQMIVLSNLQGDIVSDLCAGLVGGLGFAPSASVGDYISIFEAVHGTAPDIAGKGIANPTALLLAGIAMLRHLDLLTSAADLENALLYTLEQGVHTADFGAKSIPALSTTEFADAIIANFGQSPRFAAVASQVDRASIPPHRDTVCMHRNKLTETNPSLTKEVMGVDLFVEFNGQPEELADLVKSKIPGHLQLTMLANRGTQVWPIGSRYTELVNQYQIRCEKLNNQLVLTQRNILDFALEISDILKVCSLELLMKFGDKLGYSLVQGQ